jgi:hypothetical protein
MPQPPGHDQPPAELIRGDQRQRPSSATYLARNRMQIPSSSRRATLDFHRSSLGEAAGPVDSGVVLVYGSHTFGEVDAPEVGRTARDFRKRCEGKGADPSAPFPSSSFPAAAETLAERRALTAGLAPPRGWDRRLRQTARWARCRNGGRAATARATTSVAAGSRPDRERGRR